MHQKWVKNTKMIIENHNYMLRNTIASIETIFGMKLGFFPSPFFVTNGWFLILAKVFRNDYIDACSTARRSTTEKMKYALRNRSVFVPNDAAWKRSGLLEFLVTSPDR